MIEDYRKSHIGANKARSYDLQFQANPYRSMMWQVEKEMLDEIVADLFRAARPSHLDFACGTGRIMGHLASKTSRSVGIDVSPDMLAIARERLPECEFLEADITKGVCLLGQKFDLITAFRFFPNAQPGMRQEVLGQLRSRMAPGGILVFNNHKNRTSFIYRLGSLIRGDSQSDLGDQEVRAMLAEAGFEIEARRHVGVVPSTDRFRVLPVGLLVVMERFFGRFSRMRRWASNVVYVCRGTADARGAGR
jgi:predicted TPR repeat methyltransferase